MMLLTRRLVSMSLLLGTSLPQSATAFAPAMTAARRTFFFGMAAPGVVLDSPDDIQNALKNPNAVVLDVRGIDEIQANGYLRNTGRQWLHTPCSLTECPLLDVAAEDLIRDKDAPVIVYCASGKRATKAKEVLESKGYKQVLNAGGYPGDLEFLLK